MAFTLDHVMHFHHAEDIRADEWLLYEVYCNFYSVTVVYLTVAPNMIL